MRVAQRCGKGEVPVERVETVCSIKCNISQKTWANLQLAGFRIIYLGSDPKRKKEKKYITEKSITELFAVQFHFVGSYLKRTNVSTGGTTHNRCRQCVYVTKCTDIFTFYRVAFATITKKKMGDD